MAKQNTVWAAIAIIIVCLIMAFTVGCDKEPVAEDITPGDSYATYGDVLPSPEGHLRWVVDDKEKDKGHLEYSSGDEWVSIDELRTERERKINPPPVWGKGELPAEYTDFFGDKNGARLDYVQNQAIDKHGLIIKELARRVIALEAVDPNTVPVEVNDG